MVDIAALARSAKSLPEMAKLGGDSEFKVFCDTFRDVLGFDLARKWDHAVFDRRLPDGRGLQDILNERGNCVTARAFYSIVLAGVHLVFFTGAPDIIEPRFRDGAFFGVINFKTGEMDLRDIKLVCREPEAE